MTPQLIRSIQRPHYWLDGHRIEGAPPDVCGDLSWVYGDLTYVCGDLTHVRGDLTYVRGDLTGVCGDLTHVRGDLTHVCGDLTGVRGGFTGLVGNVDSCGLSENDRERGVQVEDLIAEISPDGR